MTFFRSQQEVLGVIQATCHLAGNTGCYTPESRKVVAALSQFFGRPMGARLCPEEELIRVFTTTSNLALDRGFLTIEAKRVVDSITGGLGIGSVVLNVHSNQEVIDAITVSCERARRNRSFTPGAVKVAYLLVHAFDRQQPSRLQTNATIRRVFIDISQRALDHGFFTVEAQRILDEVTWQLEIRPVRLDVHSNETVLDVIRASCDTAHNDGHLTPDALKVVDSLRLALNGAHSSRLYTKHQIHRVFTDVSQRTLDQGRLTLEATAILDDVVQQLGVRPVELDVHSNQAIVDEIRAACFSAYRGGYFTPQVVEVVGMLFWALGIQQSSRLHTKPALGRVFADVSKHALKQGFFTADAKRVVDEVAWQLDFRRPDLPIYSDQEVRSVVGAACDHAHRSGTLTREVIRSAVVLIRALGGQSGSHLHTKAGIYKKIQFTLWIARARGYLTSEVQQIMDLIADTLGIQRVRLLPDFGAAAALP